MTTYLIKVSVNIDTIDGVTSYRDWGLCKAENMGEAEGRAREQVFRDNREDFSDNENIETWWTNADGISTVKLVSVEPIEDETAQALEKHGIAYYLKK